MRPLGHMPANIARRALLDHNVLGLYCDFGLLKISERLVHSLLFELICNLLVFNDSIQFYCIGVFILNIFVVLLKSVYNIIVFTEE